MTKVARKTILRGSCGQFRWHIFAPRKPTKFARMHYQPGRLTFSFRWFIGWIIW